MEFLYKAYADSGEVEEGRVAGGGEKKKTGGEDGCRQKRSSG